MSVSSLEILLCSAETHKASNHKLKFLDMGVPVVRFVNKVSRGMKEATCMR